MKKNEPRHIFDSDGKQIVAGDSVALSKAGYVTQSRLVYLKPNSNSLWVYLSGDVSKTSIPTLKARKWNVKLQEISHAETEEPRAEEVSSCVPTQAPVRHVESDTNRPSNRKDEERGAVEFSRKITARGIVPHPAEFFALTKTVDELSTRIVFSYALHIITLIIVFLNLK